LSQYSFSPY
ncbi:hypothetical protein CLOM_g776, partial [Closterium sp. NIES-68]